MPISDALRAAPAALALLLAACAPAGIAGGAPTRTSVELAGAEIVVAAPQGFCIDRRSTRRSAAGAFVLVGDCALLGPVGGRARPPVGAVMTASVSTAGLGEGARAAQSLARLASFAATPAGLSALGRSGESARTRILATRTRGDALYLLVEDAGPQRGPELDRRFWRAFLEVGGRLTVLSLLAFEDAGIDPQRGLELLTAFADAVQRANPPAA